MQTREIHPITNHYPSYFHLFTIPISLSHPRHQLPPNLQPTINLTHNIMSTIGRPIPTSLRHTLRQHPLRNRIRLLHSINVQPRTNMPRNMAMKRPDPRIIGFILQY